MINPRVEFHVHSTMLTWMLKNLVYCTDLLFLFLRVVWKLAICIPYNVSANGTLLVTLHIIPTKWFLFNRYIGPTKIDYYFHPTSFYRIESLKTQNEGLQTIQWIDMDFEVELLTVCFLCFLLVWKSIEPGRTVFLGGICLQGFRVWALSYVTVWYNFSIVCNPIPTVTIVILIILHFPL